MFTFYGCHRNAQRGHYICQLPGSCGFSGAPACLETFYVNNLAWVQTYGPQVSSLSLTVYHVWYCIVLYSVLYIKWGQFLTVGVGVNWVHSHSSLVKVFICTALLCVPLVYWLITITWAVHTALVCIRHFYHPGTNIKKQSLNITWPNLKNSQNTKTLFFK